MSLRVYRTVVAVVLAVAPGACGGGSNGGRDLAFNLDRPPFDDARARRAVALAYDRDKANDALFAGSGRPAETLLAEGSPYRDPS
jgi:ABC-type transport system substrate-binding protein